MQKSTENYLAGIKKSRILRRNVMQFICALSILVIFGVFWCLKLTGITLAGEAFCGKEEHVHDETCQTEALICTLEEHEGHIHTEECYGVCTECEKEEHAHGEACQTEKLICTLEENEDHVHTEECYEICMECEIEEHAHDETCQVNELICTLEEKAEHIHTEECYGICMECEKEEHVHDKSCYSDLTADLETAEIWEASLQGIDENASDAERILQAARSQLGTAESTLNFSVDTEGVRRGITRYGQWYGNPYGDWSGMFVCFCLHYAGITDEMVPYNAGTETMRLEWEAAGLIRDDREPEAGDLLFLDTDQDAAAEMVGFISEAGEENFRVILGDYEDTAAEIEVERNAGEILSIGSIAEAFESNISEEDRLRIENVNQRIAALPTVEEITAKQAELEEDSEEYQIWYQELALNALTTYAYYEDLPESLRQLVTDAARLEELSWIWEGMFLNIEPKGSFDVYQVNSYEEAVTTIVFGGTVQKVLGSKMSFKYWDAVVVEKNSDGLLVVDEIHSEEASKLNLGAETEDGFVLLLYDQSPESIQVGQQVLLDSDFYKTKHAYTASPIGTVTFAEEKPEYQLTEVSAESTKELITIDLYDYGSNINDLWNSDKKYPGFQAGNGTESISSLTQWSMNFGDNIKAEPGGTVTNQGGEINKTDVTESANRPISGAMSSKLKDGYPALSDGTSLAYLFSNGQYAKKQNTANIDGLFRYDEDTGLYHFNSRENNAQFNPESNTFTLYQELLTTNFIMYPFGNFMPFNNIKTQTTQVTDINGEWFRGIAASALQKYNAGKGAEYKTLSDVLTNFVNLMDSEEGTSWNYQNAMEKYFSLNGLSLPKDDPEGTNLKHLSNLYSIDYDEATDFFFGMSMQASFMQPKDGTAGITEIQPMKYHFKGDDDVWVYIDGVLFLDLSGIHRHVGGTIDFEKGVVEYYALEPATGEIGNNPYKTVRFEEILGSSSGLNDKGTFEDYSVHTMNFYYMERGAGSGVCEIEFNFPLLKQNGITVTKKLDGIEGSVLGNPDFYFQCYKENGQELLIGEGVSYNILDENGNVIGKGTTGKNGVFSIKAGQSADFGDVFKENEGRYFVRELLDPSVFAQYGTITIDGTAITSNASDVTVGTTTFKGVDSPVKDISEGSTSFLFCNHVEMSKIGRLEVSKEVSGAVDNSTREQEFAFLVKFDGEPVPAGTDYFLKDASGKQELKHVNTAGQIVLKHGQTACFENVLAGTEVFVAETKESAGEFKVTYSGDITLVEKTDTSSGENGVSGTVSAETGSHVKVRNALEGAEVTIQGTKTLVNQDGESHEYTFLLQQIGSIEDLKPVEGGTTQTQTVSIMDKEQSFEFQLIYPKGTAPGTYYYLITEQGAEETPGMDSSKYIAVVTLKEENGELKASAEIFKNDASEPAEKAAFVNSIVRSLTVQKTVENISTTDSFEFEITASLNGAPLEGTFSCIGLERTNQLTFTGGKATVHLMHQQSITIQGLPYGLTYTVTEKNAAGYVTKYQVGDTAPQQYGTSGGGKLTTNTTVSFLNSPGIELPATGTYLRLGHLIGGWALIFASLIIGIVIRYDRKRKTQ